MIQAWEITDELKAEFIQLIYQGKKPDQAARDLDSTATQFRKFRSPNSQWYDPDFHVAYEKAISSEEHQHNFLEELRDVAWKKARAGDSNLLTKYLMIYDPDWEVLRHQNLRVTGSIDHIHQLAERFTREQLVEMREARVQEIEQENVRALPPPAA